MAVLTTLVVVLSLPVLVFEARPSDWERLEVAGDMGHSYGALEYQPGQDFVWLELILDNLLRWDDVSYRIEWDEPWTPRWEGRIRNHVEGGLRVRYWFRTPEPMDAERARRLAGGLRVQLSGEGMLDHAGSRERAVTFTISRWERSEIQDAYRYWWLTWWADAKRRPPDLAPPASP